MSTSEPIPFGAKIFAIQVPDPPSFFLRRKASMQALAIIDMQRWMFRTPERAAQLPALVPTLNRLSARFDAAGHPVFDVRVIHQADRSTWSRLMLKYDY